MIDEEKRNALISRFNAEMGSVQRPGADKLMEYIRKSDFFTAPASTRFHLSCKGGLLQHSLNVLDALRSILRYNPDGKTWEYIVAGKVLLRDIPNESVTIIALLHDICKTYFYGVSMRNAKNEQTGQWEKVPYYTVNDRMPLGHGAKSAMIIKQYMALTNQEMYAIWHHMGFTGGQDDITFRNAVELYPLVWATHTADMMASCFMEDEKGNRELFTFAELAEEQWVKIPCDDESIIGGGTEETEPPFEEAPSVEEQERAAAMAAHETLKSADPYKGAARALPIREMEGFYKARRRDGGGWIEGYLFFRVVEGLYNKPHITPDGLQVFEINPVTLSRYIGVKDRHGKPIYENDIIWISDKGYRLVEWSEENLSWMYSRMSHDGEYKYEYEDYIAELPRSRMVIKGNIFENENLLETGDEEDA